MASIVKLHIFTEDDIIVAYCQLLSKYPCSIALNKVGIEVLKSADPVYLIKFEDDRFHKYMVDVVSTDGDGHTVTLALNEVSVSLNGHEQHCVNYRGRLTVKEISKGELSHYQNVADVVNENLKGSPMKKIEASMLEEDLSTQNIFRLLFAINSKLDKIIDIVSPVNEDSSADMLNSIDISSTAIRFFSKSDLSLDDCVYANLKLDDTSISTNFAFVGTITDKAALKLGNVYTCEYLNLDGETREEIVRFVFAKEREHLKGVRS